MLEIQELDLHYPSKRVTHGTSKLNKITVKVSKIQQDKKT